MDEINTTTTRPLPRWHVDGAEVWAYAFPVGAAVAVAAAWAVRRRSRAPLAAALVYLGTLFPVLGFVNVYPFVYSYVADHFAYVPSLAVFGALPD